MTRRGSRPPPVAPRLLVALVAALLVSARPAPAVADDRPATRAPRRERAELGVRVALRSGVAVPLGQAFVAAGALSSVIAAYLPLRLDVGYRLGGHVYVGVAGQLAVVVPSGCPVDGRCSGRNARVGALVAYHLRPARAFDPWLGVGMGYEVLTVSRSVGDARVDLTASGLELLDVEIGADARVGRAVHLGPVLSTSIGRYAALRVNETSTRDFDASIHAWVMLGLRGALDF